MRGLFILSFGLSLMAAGSAHIDGKESAKKSQSIGSVLRQALPPEDLSLSQNDTAFIIDGPSFSYRIEKKTGVIGAIRAVRGQEQVLSTSGYADIFFDQYHLAAGENSCEVSIVRHAKNQIVLKAKCVLRDPEQQGPEVDCEMIHRFYNDGVVVSAVTLIPRADFPLKQSVRYQLPATGSFSNYLHKRRDENGEGAARGKLPSPGEKIGVSTLTSCLSIYGPAAALAIFTDSGAMHLSRPNLETAMANVIGNAGEQTSVDLCQYLVRIAPDDPPYVLKAHKKFAFRVGISLAPNRLPHPRTHDLRMFIWIGDKKYPYPSDEEITKVAQSGYTVFQLHRVGTPSEPRPPVGELERVIRKVHELGLLFLWEENADLLYDSAPGVQDLKAKGHWSLWQGFNYNGRYVASMDPYCDLVATCLAAPNGMAEYRLANIERMLKRYDVDGIYLDDNLAYSNCKLWREHGHPQKIYDCLIELHEMNWRRRELLRDKVPHMVLVSHNTKAFILPILSDFDVQYFAEGYCFDSAADYWDNYRAWGLSLNAQSMICPGDDEGIRCNAALACNYDLLAGGGQDSQMDWRLFPGKFNYAGGVTPRELDYCRTYNLAQSYFGLYESHAFCYGDSTNLFSTSSPGTFATIYRNQVWDDLLIPIANMHSEAQKTSLVFHSPKTLGILPEPEYLLFDIHNRIVKTFRGDALNEVFNEVFIPGQNLQLYAMRRHSADVPCHIWGGKRLSESWDSKQRKLTFQLQGPAGLADTVFVGGSKQGIEKILVAGRPGDFAFDSIRELAHGVVTFTPGPLKIEVFYSTRHINALPEGLVNGDPITQQNL